MPFSIKKFKLRIYEISPIVWSAFKVIIILSEQQKSSKLKAN